MLLALILIFTSQFAQAAPFSLGARLVQLLPEGYSEGVTEKGAPCRVVFSWSRGANRDPSYARAQVIAEPEGNLVDAEIFFDGYRGKAHGRWSKKLASVRYQQNSLSATRTPKGLLIKAEKRVSFRRKALSASCLIQPTVALNLGRAQF